MLKFVLRHRSVLVTLLMIPAVLAGCGIGNPVGHDRTVVGTYALQQFNGVNVPATVNGVNVPATVYEDASLKLEVLSGALILDSDGQYREPISLRRTNKSNAQVIVVAQEDTGTYTVSGNTITFVSVDGAVGTYTGTWSVNTIAYTSGGVSMTFLRR